MALSSPGTGSTATTTDASTGPGPARRGLLPLLLVGNSAMYALYGGVAFRSRSRSRTSTLRTMCPTSA